MNIRFFADHCVSNYVIQELHNAGHEVLRLKNHIPTDSPDSVVISKAQELDAILISLNGDFADIVTYPQQTIRVLSPFRLKIIPRLCRS